MKIEQGYLDILKSAGACSDRLELYSAGMDVSEIAFGDALWVEDTVPWLVADFEVPLWAMVVPGYGDGHGNGSGYGSGYGYGDGSGYGKGNGYGYGSGSGSGYGDGD